MKNKSIIIFLTILFTTLQIHSTVHDNNKYNEDDDLETEINNNRKYKNRSKCRRCRSKKEKAAMGFFGGGIVGAGVGAGIGSATAQAGTGALIGGPIGAFGGLVLSQIL